MRIEDLNTLPTCRTGAVFSGGLAIPFIAAVPQSPTAVPNNGQEMSRHVVLSRVRCALYK